jgi:uroporphyrinogen-III synthase
MHVLITRPESDAMGLKSRIEALGCEITIAPLIDIELNRISADVLSRASAVIATSRNGLRALAQSPAIDAARHLPLFVVGPATAALARELGLISIIEGAGTAADLVPVLTEHPSTRQGDIVHFTGDHLAFDLGAALAAQGHRYKKVEAYRSVAAKTFTQPVVELLSKRALDAVVLMSPRTARVWSDMVQALPEKPDLTKLVHICLSDTVKQALATLGPVSANVAKRPTSDEIVALLYQLAGRRKTG